MKVSWKISGKSLNLRLIWSNDREAAQLDESTYRKTSDDFGEKPNYFIIQKNLNSLGMTQHISIETYGKLL